MSYARWLPAALLLGAAACEDEPPPDELTVCQQIRNSCGGIDTDLARDCLDMATELLAKESACEARFDTCDTECTFGPQYPEGGGGGSAE